MRFQESAWRDALRALRAAAAIALAMSRFDARGQIFGDEEEVFTPHLVSRIPPEPPRVYPAPKIAEIYSMYEVDTNNWDEMKIRVTQRLANSLEYISPDYLEISHVEPLVFGDRCRPELLNCNLRQGQSMRDADVRNCQGRVEPIDPLLLLPPMPVWMPKWNDKVELEALAWDTFMCISEANTSLLKFPFIMYNTYLTGLRDLNNTRIYGGSGNSPVKWELHVVGKIPIQWARFLNVKFQLNGSIPLPEYQPELLDDSATVTDDLNITIEIFGVRQNNLTNARPPIHLAEYLPVCEIPVLKVKGCFRIDHNFYEHPKLTYYKLQYFILWNRYQFARLASDTRDFTGDFNVSRGPWPSFEWVGPLEARSVGPWQQYKFPQKDWRFLESCKFETECDTIPLAPSPRYLHSAVLYKTWNFAKHARNSLCNERMDCFEDCLINLTCLGGADAYFADNFFFRSERFRYDDGGVEAPLSLQSMDCPRGCCKDRRICMRVNDVMGYEVPFDATYMLIFGGKTFVHTKDASGKLVYHGCEQIKKAEMDQHPEWRSCQEVISNEMWRYDIVRGKWEFMKPDSSTSPTTGLPVGYPLARYGHAATMVETEEEGEGLVRRWLYIYGGLSPQCAGGVCNDMWKYEIPWAAQAYYPKFPEGTWDRANMWYRLKDGFFGGRYRHDMVTTSGGEYIYIFGGQGIGEYYDSLFRYRISTDMWEDLRPFGRRSLTRYMYDYMGQPQKVQVPVSKYNAKVDPDCRIETYIPHCKVCPECRLNLGRRGSDALLPEPRVDFGMTFFQDPDPDAADDSLLVIGGFRTTWGSEDQEGTRSGLMEVGADAGDQTFYFQDVWKYEASINQFMEISTDDERPAARRGHRIVALRSRTNDTHIMLFGGHQQDKAFDDVWVLAVNRPKEERIWARIDPYIKGSRPPPTSHHTMLYDQDLNMIILFGGISWKETDLSVTDMRRNVDRRCYKMAQELYEKYQGPGTNWNEEFFLGQMAESCATSKFCCQISDITAGVTEVLDGVDIRFGDGTLDLRALGRYCREDCKNRSFIPDFYPILSVGVWTYVPDACGNNCSGHGVCELSQCICELGWYGTDCSLPRCPGSMCYTHPRTQLQTCIECSQHGRCINGQCVCYSGWGFEDCSAVLCEDNCSSTLDVTRGICIEDFPVHSCVCTDNWSGEICNVQLCLNNCSRRGDCIEGVCQCHQNFHGEDCSLFTFRISQDLTEPYTGVRALGI